MGAVPSRYIVGTAGMKTYSLEEARAEPKGQIKSWLYNALDCTGTREIADILLPRLNKNQALTYAFERALQAPALSMMLRGVRVNQELRKDMVKGLEKEIAQELRGIAKMPAITDIWDGTRKETGWCPAEFGKHHKWPKGEPDATRHCIRCNAPRMAAQAFSPTSPDQTSHLFFDLLKVPEMTNKKGKVSTDEDVLERIGRKFPDYRAITDAILAVRDKEKQSGSLNARLGNDGRYYSSFNVGSAWTGRFSSSKNPFGLGGNLQNVAERHRKVFIADPGMVMGYADYMQGESNIVAHLAGDEKYIEAHTLGDVHTYVTRYIWPDLPWTGDLKRDKLVAKVNPPWDTAPGHDYRFQCKRIQHGSNYGLTPRGISLIAHIPLFEAKRAYDNYMTEFDSIPAWQDRIAGDVREHKPLINPLGREITLMGRPWDKHTIKQGLSFLPQSTLADIEDIALWRVWHDLEPEGLLELAQVHDAILHEFPSDRNDLETRMLGLMSIPTPITDIRGVTRVMNIGVEAAVGKNWSHASKDNPHGLKEFHT